MQARARLMGNASPAQSLDLGLFEKETIYMIKDFETKPAFNKVIRGLAERNLEKLLGRVKAMTVAISVAIMLGSLGMNAYSAYTGIQVQKIIQSQYNL